MSSSPHAAAVGVAVGHRFDLPEVTFCAHGIANPALHQQHGAMSYLRRILLQPMNVALLLTWLAVWLSFSSVPPEKRAATSILMCVFLLAALLPQPGLPGGNWKVPLLIGVQTICGLMLVYLAPYSGTTPVLLVVVAAQLGMIFSLRTCLLVLLLIDMALYVLLRDSLGHGRALFTVLIYIGFQGFALLVGHYASTAERARDALSLVNADLLATRALLADSARDAERLRVARELHDVAGHKLTALKLNLRALASDPTLADRDEVRIAQQLSSELLDDIRGLVQTIRDTRGLDLDTALRALAAPLPKLQLELHIAPDVHVTDPVQAETLLRLAQESLTNAARHAGASHVRLVMTRDADGIDITIEDDGKVKGVLKEGNGMAGMRERIAEAKGHFELGRTETGGLRIHASLPA